MRSEGQTRSFTVFFSLSAIVTPDVVFFFLFLLLISIVFSSRFSAVVVIVAGSGILRSSSPSHPSVNVTRHLLPLFKNNLNLNAPASSGPVSVLLLVGLPAAVPLAKHDDEEEGAQPADAAPEAKDAADYGLNEKGKLLFLLQIVAL